jgi:hypothetical protein
VANSLAYYNMEAIMAVKSVLLQAPGQMSAGHDLIFLNKALSLATEFGAVMLFLLKILY